VWILVGVLLKLLLEQLDTDRYIELATYDWLQFRLSTAVRQEIPTVLDISNLPGGTREDDPTSRPDLKSLIQAVAALKPRAIGVDLDCGPVASDSVLQKRQDRDFLESCLETETRYQVPIFLGVERSLDRSPDQWLGGARYRQLAAHMYFPKLPQPIEGQEPLVREAERANLWLELEDVHAKCPSLAAALTGARLRPSDASRLPPSGQPPRPVSVEVQYRTHHPRPLLRRFVRWSDDHDFLVNYGPLPRLREATHRHQMVFAEDVKADGADFQGKLVLIGRAEKPQADLHLVPGRCQIVPGVMVQACAAYSLDQAPLYELTSAGRLAIDALLGALIVGLVTLARYLDDRHRPTHPSAGGHLGHPGPTTAEHGLHGLALTVVLAGVLLGVTALVRLSGLMWDDFLFVIGALLIHSPIEDSLEVIWRWVRYNLPRLGPEPAASDHKRGH
jgi:CHASE2 domain-containing sensor protein